MSDASADRTRVFAAELREQARHGSEALALAIGAIAFAHLTLVLAAAGVVTAFWETHRVAAIGGVATLYAACAIACLLRLRTGLDAMSRGFPGTRAILREDVERLRALRAGLATRAAATTGALAWLARGIVVARFTRAVAKLLSPGVRNRTDARR